MYTKLKFGETHPAYDEQIALYEMTKSILDSAIKRISYKYNEGPQNIVDCMDEMFNLSGPPNMYSIEVIQLIDEAYKEIRKMAEGKYAK